MSFWKEKCNESTWWGVGIGAGVAIGVATHQLALWIAIGVVMSCAMQSAFHRKRTHTQ